MCKREEYTRRRGRDNLKITLLICYKQGDGEMSGQNAIDDPHFLLIISTRVPTASLSIFFPFLAFSLSHTRF